MLENVQIVTILVLDRQRCFLHGQSLKSGQGKADVLQVLKQQSVVKVKDNLCYCPNFCRTLTNLDNHSDSYLC